MYGNRSPKKDKMMLEKLHTSTSILKGPIPCGRKGSPIVHVESQSMSNQIKSNQMSEYGTYMAHAVGKGRFFLRVKTSNQMS